MPFAANTKHYAALWLVSLGVMGAMISGVAIFAAFSGKNGEVIWGAVGCGAVGLIPSALLIRSGFRVRNRAVEQGSTAHLGAEETGPTSRTEVAKPSFLRDEDEG